ncbi:pentatricopeptide repeat-containing protein At2g20540 [Cannabis sativa]|uniref:pentatricopeptide repeat-containing protein At2g20540 n=1 Tax=Cannabis sativa TaxID=3483 RepID=UPI0029CA3636|nr:pentatricopeptide repeat-containing protein At2g20540 [Cannabis sativa]XP_060967577.1 pentatricopeptide repeat-containing protein At2g20540 [Cannabis sativa]
MSLYSATTRRCLLLLEKCKNMKDLKQAHASIITTGLGSNNFALSRVLDFCSKPHHGNPFHAWKIFQHIQNPTICIWNTILKAFLLHNELIQTILVYRNLLQSGIVPDNYTLPYVLKACSRLKSVHLGESVHGHGMKLGLVFDLFVGNSLIVMYCEFRNMEGARYVFDEMSSLSVVSWTVMIFGYAKVGEVDNARLFFDVAPVRDKGIWGAMISGYVQNACFKEGLHLFRLMQLTDIEPDEAIFVSILSGCAHLGAFDFGIWIHRYLDRLGLPLSIRLSTGLIDMYAKCGNLDLAKRIFHEMPQKDTVCWNAMISAMAINGDGEAALELFRDMEKTGVQPDDITFIAIFTACSYSGMAYEGLRMFEKMRGVYRIEPKTEHYGCMVDLLSRAGHFEEAKQIIQRVIISTNPSEEKVAWRAFLSACCTHGQTQLAELAFGKLLELESGSGFYVLLSNLYASVGKDSDARRVRKLMKHRGVEKLPGCSLIEIEGGVHEFVAGGKMDP